MSTQHYVAPRVKLDAFNCPHCGAYAKQDWRSPQFNLGPGGYTRFRIAAWTVLARVLSWAKNRGIIAVNPCEKGGRVYHGSRAEIVWSEVQIAAFLTSAPLHLITALLLGLWTGQREGDLIRLRWSAYDGKKIRLKQSKGRKKTGGGRRVFIPVGKVLKAHLDSLERTGPNILMTTRNTEWTENGFQSSWGKACAKAGIVGVTFNDLRGTSVTRLALAGSTEAEIATLTGHTMQQVRDILDKHYLNRDVRLAESAIRKWDRFEAKRSLLRGTKTG